jgi:hypothetical protein
MDDDLLVGAIVEILAVSGPPLTKHTVQTLAEKTVRRQEYDP